MDPNNSKDSLDKQVNRVFRKRSRASFWTAMAATGAFLLSTLTGCFAKDIRAFAPADNHRARAAAFQSNLPDIAETLGLYDAATSTYDAAKVKAEAEKQLAPDADPNSLTGYLNLTDYSNVDHLLATRYALGKVIEQNNDYINDNEADPAKQVEVEKRKKENEDFENLREEYRAALETYNLFGSADPGRSDKDRMRCSLAVGLGYYAQGTKEGDRNWRTVTQIRKSDFGTYIIGDQDDLEYTAERYFGDLERAVNNRQGKVRRNRRAAFWTAVGTLVIGLIASQDDEGGSGPGDIGGEDGGEGGY